MLLALVEKLLLVGDLINRGSQSKEVVSFVRENRKLSAYCIETREVFDVYKWELEREQVA